MNQQSNTNNSTNFDEIFNTGHQSSINPTIYQQDRYNLKNIDMSSANDFNYNHLGNHVEIYKSNSDKKDAFSFVGDMLKSNKN